MLRRIVPAAALLCAVLAVPAHAAEYDWTPAGSLSQARTGAASATLGDGRVLVIGGSALSARKDVATVDVFDPRTQTWSAGAPLQEPRMYPSAVTLRDGRVLVLGGVDEADQRVAELFDPATGAWKRVASSIAPHVAAPGFVLADGRVLFLGGSYYWSQWPTGEIYDPAKDEWTLTAEPSETAGAGPAVVRLRDGRFLVLGSKNVYAEPHSYDVATAEIYDAAQNTWTKVTPPRAPRQSAGAALLPDGRVLVAGGHPGSTPSRMFDATSQSAAELFDPATGSWTSTGDLSRPRGAGSTLVTLADGRPVVFGGSWATIGWDAVFQRRVLADIFFEATAEVYDVATGTWQATPAAPSARSSHVATALADGSLLVATGVSHRDSAGTTATERLVPRPAPPAAPAPLPVVPPTTKPKPKPSKPGTLRFTAPPKRLKLPRAGTLTFKVRCARGGPACSDRLVLRGRGRVLAQRDVSVKPGKTANVQVKLGASARRALRHRSTRISATLRRQGTKVSVNVRG